MASKNETVEEVISAERDLIERSKADSEELKIECVFTDEEVISIIDRFEAAHKRDRETARRRAERSAIYNMLESFPYDWECNPEAVKKWIAIRQRNADDLCEGGMYAE